MYNSQFGDETQEFLRSRRGVLLQEYKDTMATDPRDMYQDTLYISHIARALDRLSRSYLCNHNLGPGTKYRRCTKCDLTLRV